MARLVSQTLGITSDTLTFLHSTATKIHSAAEKGSVTRGLDAFDATMIALLAMFVVALAVGAALLWVLYDDWRQARIRATVVCPYAFAPETRTKNLRNPHK